MWTLSFIQETEQNLVGIRCPLSQFNPFRIISHFNFCYIVIAFLAPVWSHYERLFVSARSVMWKKRLSRTRTDANTNAKGTELPQVQKKAPLSRRKTGGTVSLPDGLAPGLAEKAAKHPELAAKLIAMSGFAEYLTKVNVDGLKVEFLKLRSTKIASTQSAFMANQRKCRYKDVGCADETRAVLTANYVKNEEMKNTFIACQGPVKVTVEDFWTMAWQENCSHFYVVRPIQH
ncbi:unnamed protein product [Bursaphelenchus okinawaensis]|uniref:Tyrosine-protein phosphatase domain-containing protein n=1 Tax=Bursaphelenchus okinawaensis TaxID=465554 RepID=A0A811L639_9BILA|nr:unnamed protein product [Bursaphelenchus okinawaensis]CAG9117300.1 unnamed protein product [Bursaphelenchus okinawaensis]